MATDDQKCMEEYGCLFIRPGQETKAIPYMDNMLEICAIGLERTYYRSVNGIRHTERQRLMPGYLFFRAQELPPPELIRKIPGFIRTLRYQSGEWELSGSDRSFAEYVFEKNGLFGVSKACKIGDRIRLIDGPLKDYEGAILKLDRHRKNGLVELSCHGRSFRVWLPFDIVSVLGAQADREEDHNGGITL